VSVTDSSSGIFIEPSVNDSLNAKENKWLLSDFSVEQEFHNYCSVNKERTESILWAQELFDQQKSEKLVLKEKNEKESRNETRELLEQEIFIDMTRVFVYEHLWIDNNKEENWAIGNFFKGIVDEIIIWNFEFALQVWETKWKIIIDIFNQLRTIEWLKMVLSGIWASIWDLFTWDAYERWKSVGELWILFVWVGWAYKFSKMVVKWAKQWWAITKAWVMAVGMTAGFETWLAFSKTIVQWNMDKKRMVIGAPVRRNMKKIEDAIEDIIPKKKIDVEETMVKNNILNGKKRIDKKLLDEMLPVDEEVFQNLFAVVKERKLSHINKLWWEKYFNSKLKKLSRKLWLKENITLSNYIDAGENGIMAWGSKINIDGVKMAVKLPSQFADRYFPNEIKNHQLYYTVYESWKKKVHSEMWITDNVLLKIPKVKNYNGYYLTENLSDHISLERFLQRELIREKFGDKFDFDIYSLDSQELRILGTELWVEFMNTYTKIKLPLIDKKDLGLIKNFLWYANKSWLFHRDIKVDNIMVPKDISTPWESIYLVDYWEAFVDKKYFEPKDISVNDVKNTIESDLYEYRDVMFMDMLGEKLVK